MAAVIAGAAPGAAPIAIQSTPHAAATIFITTPLSPVAAMAIPIIAAAVRADTAAAAMGMADAVTHAAGAYLAGCIEVIEKPGSGLFVWAGLTKTGPARQLAGAPKRGYIE